MIKLSAVIITFNEEKNIERCLRSLQGVADEIVVVDSYSKDKTKALCENFKLRFIEHSFEGHIQQKNFALTQASYDYCLSLDADEELSPALKKSIMQVKENWHADGYYMNRLTNYCGQWIKHSGWYPDRKLRLFDKRKGQWAGLNPHDRYTLKPGGKESRIKGDLLHYTYYTVEEHRMQVEKFTSIAAKALFDGRVKSNFKLLYINPIAKFISSFLIRLGFLDGLNGWRISIISAYATHLKYKKLRELESAAHV